MIESIKYIAIYLVTILAIWVVGNQFANQVSDYEVIQPTEGVECVVVSRMFNTSVDCWK